MTEGWYHVRFRALFGLCPEGPIRWGCWTVPLWRVWYWVTWYRHHGYAGVEYYSTQDIRQLEDNRQRIERDWQNWRREHGLSPTPPAT